MENPTTIYELIQAHYAGKINLAKFKEHAKRICTIYNPEWGKQRMENHIKSILKRLEKRYSIRTKIGDET